MNQIRENVYLCTSSFNNAYWQNVLMIMAVDFGDDGDKVCCLI